MNVILKAIQKIFGSNEVEVKLKYVAFRKISNTQATVPEGHIWITREITVDNKQTHSWFLFYPFNSIYRFDSAIKKGNVVYLQWSDQKGKVKKANSPSIGNNITANPVWFDSGTTLSTFNDRVLLEVIELSVQP